MRIEFTSVCNPAKGLLRSSYGAVISPYIDELYDYQHPFRVEHMHHVLNVLQIGRAHV